MSTSAWRRLAGSFQFLTALPIRGKTSSPGEAAVFFPLTGAVIGGAAGMIARYAGPVFGRPLGALLALAFLLLISGGLHEDGLADVADAVRAGRSKERMLTILKDSRIGTYGAGALIMSSLMRWQAIENLNAPFIPALCLAVGLARASMVVVAGSTSTVGTGLGQSFATGCRRETILWVALQCVLLFAGCGWYVGWMRVLTLGAICAAAAAVMRAWFNKRLGGVNGDCLGATCVMVETAALLVMAGQRFI